MAIPNVLQTIMVTSNIGWQGAFTFSILSSIFGTELQMNFALSSVIIERKEPLVTLMLGRIFRLYTIYVVQSGAKK